MSIPKKHNRYSNNRMHTHLAAQTNYCPREHTLPTSRGARFEINVKTRTRAHDARAYLANYALGRLQIAPHHNFFASCLLGKHIYCYGSKPPSRRSSLSLSPRPRRGRVHPWDPHSRKLIWEIHGNSRKLIWETHGNSRKLIWETHGNSRKLTETHFGNSRKLTFWRRCKA